MWVFVWSKPEGFQLWLVMGTNNIIKKDNEKLNNKIISHSDSHNSIMAPLTSQVKEQEINIKGTVIGRVKFHVRF